jgi:hypothetical protein
MGHPAVFKLIAQLAGSKTDRPYKMLFRLLGEGQDVAVEVKYVGRVIAPVAKLQRAQESRAGVQSTIEVRLGIIHQQIQFRARDCICW